MGSERLPGKVLRDLQGTTVLERCLRRAARSNYITSTVVATTILPQDDLVAALATNVGAAIYRGSELDLLDRYYQAARIHQADVIVRLTADNPLVEAEIIDAVLDLYLQGDLDYVCNRQPRTFPLGLDVEACSMEALEQAWMADTRADWREHVTPYIIYHPEKFRQAVFSCERDYSHMRWTVDTEEDLKLCREIFAAFPDDRFHWREVLELLEARPELATLNSKVQQRKVSR